MAAASLRALAVAHAHMAHARRREILWCVESVSMCGGGRERRVHAVFSVAHHAHRNPEHTHRRRAQVLLTTPKGFAPSPTYASCALTLALRVRGEERRGEGGEEREGAEREREEGEGEVLGRLAD